MALVFAFRTHFRVKSLSLLLVATSKVHARITSGKITLHPPTSTAQVVLGQSTEFKDFVALVAEIIPIDVTVLLLILLGIVFILCYIAYRRKKKQTARTTLSLYIGNAKLSAQWKIADLLFGPAYYKLAISQQLVDLELHERTFASSLDWASGVVVTNKLLKMPVKLPTSLFTAPWLKKTTRAILARPHYALSVVTDAEDGMVEVGVLSPWVAQDLDVIQAVMHQSVGHRQAWPRAIRNCIH